MIRTPDQRLRVFVSSTLTELGPERKAVKAAIEELRLIPVLFESGARPHAPQDLYRAYLEQSEVFVGIYGSSYGWVAPDMRISGLEDELNLSGERPKLIYVKNVDGERDARLLAMLARVKDTGGVSYQKFNTAEELADLVQNDLAVLLSERFAREHAAPDTTQVATALPVLRGPSIGRAKDLAALCALLDDQGSGLITVTGPGGTGKSRICLMVAHETRHRFKDGAVFVPLASIEDHVLVAPAIAGALGIFDNARRSAAEGLKDILREKELLLVLDNFEQVLDAATLLTGLLEHCPRLRILVSSRTPLHLRGEQVYPLAPLEEPADPEQKGLDELLAYPAVDLFVKRARESAADLMLDEPNVRAIAAICHKLDGLPLAIELAAAHTRMLQPVALKQRMENALGLLTRGARDLPERQRTMRATIAWSHDLLDAPARAIFRRLALFADRFTLADAHAVAGGTGSEYDTMLAIEQLVDQGLVRRFAAPDWADGGQVFALLHVVREFAAEALAASGERDDLARRHAQHFARLSAELERAMLSAESLRVIDRLDAAQADIRAAFWHWINTGDRAAAWRLIADQRGYLSHSGRVSESLTWMKAAGLYPAQAPPEMSAFEAGRAHAAAGLALAVAGHYVASAALLTQAIERLEGQGEGWELCRALSYLGLAQLSMGDPAAAATFQRCITTATRIGDDFDACMSLSFLSEACIIANDLAGAEATIQRARPIAERHRAGSAEAMYALECANLLLVQGRIGEALVGYDSCVRIFESARMMPLSGWGWWGVCYASFLLGDMRRAREGFAICLDRARRTSDDAMACAALLCASIIAHAEGDTDTSAQLLGSAEAIAASIHYAFWSTDRLLHAELQRRLQDVMDETRMRLMMEQGARLEKEQAIALALTLAPA